MRFLMVIISLLFLFSACGNSQQEKPDLPIADAGSDSTKRDSLAPLPLSDLVVHEEDFGEVIELEGTPHPVDQLFMVSESEMITLDSIFIMKNQTTSDMFIVFSLPDFRFIKSFGKFGRGPGEFQYPALVKDESGKYLCFIYERTTNDIYALSKSLEVIELPVKLDRGGQNFSDKQLYGISEDNFLYVESVKNGKALFEYKAGNDSSRISLLQHISFPDKGTNWMNYIGDFGVNGKQDRAVFAFKSFKRLLFFDLEQDTTRSVIFQDADEPEVKKGVSIMAPTNITHYWGMSAQDKYVYVLYSGRSPVDVSREINESSGYIYVEKFDWNGNPVSKYKLDHWGYFCVNEAENIIYLASNTEEQPLLSYRIPE